MSSFFRLSPFFFVLAACGGHTDAPPGPPAAPPPGETPPPGSPPPPGNPPPPAPTDDPRAAARAASIFKNLDFEDVDASGTPAAWTCYCATGPAACKTVTSGAKHGQRALVLPSGCRAYQKTSAFTAGEGVRFDYFTRGGVVGPFDARILVSETVALNTDGLASAPKDWTALASRGAAPTAGSKSLFLMISNMNGALDYPQPDGDDLFADDIVAVQDGADPPPQVGTLLRATHFDQFGYAPGASPGSIYVSLPIDWASQTPLHFELTVTPKEIVDHVTYAVEEEHNWGATIAFAPNAKADTVVLRWDSVVLTRAVPDAELPTVFAAQAAPDQWLAASEIADFTYAPIGQTAQGLVTSGMTPLDKMLAVIGWTSSSLGGTGQLTGLDATTVFKTRTSSCTGYANLAMAMGRAVGVPTRHVTNIMVGEAQDMHSIDEFYLGPDLGWRRVEPQGTAPRVPDDYGFIMRLVLPGDESPLANRASPGGPLMSGIPLHEFTETLAGPEHITQAASYVQTFNDCTYCGTRADSQADLRDVSADAMKALFDRARASWQKDLAAFGAMSPARLATRRKALDAKKAADVGAILDAL
jgi:hypothetical protein